MATVERLLRAVRMSTTLMWRLTLWTLQREDSDMMFDRLRLGRGAACLVPCVFRLMPIEVSAKSVIPKLRAGHTCGWRRATTPLTCHPDFKRFEGATTGSNEWNASDRCHRRGIEQNKKHRRHRQQRRILAPKICRVLHDRQDKTKNPFPEKGQHFMEVQHEQNVPAR